MMVSKEAGLPGSVLQTLAETIERQKDFCYFWRLKPHSEQCSGILVQSA
jgi:hypothetical protein